jgi:hypothetical protein
MKIARPTAKSMDRYIVVNAGLVIGNNPERLQRLSRNELRRLYRQLTIEMAKTGVEFKIRGELDANQIQNNLIFVEKKIPISETLNRDQFLRDLRDIDYAIVIAQQTIGLAIDDQD